MKNKFILFVFLIFSIPLFLRAQPNECLKIGTNFGGFSYYSCDFPLKNVFKTSSDWIPFNANGSGDFSNPVKRVMTFDANGYPTKIPQYVTTYDRGYPLGVLTLNQDQAVRSLFFRGGCSEFPRSTGAQNSSAGNLYNVYWEGEGDISFKNPNGGDYYHITDGGFSGSVGVTATKITSTGGGTHSCKLYVPTNLSVENGIYLNITRSQQGNNIRSIRVLMPGFTDVDNDADPWHPTFLNYLRPFYSIRFMGAMGTNSTNPSVDKLWNMRKSKDLFSYSSGGEVLGHSMPYEMIADLCNRLKKHAWVNVLCDWDDDHIRRFANLMKSSLDPSLDVYVEFGNEATWNYAAPFKTFGCLNDQAQQTGKGISEVMALAERKTWKIFRQEFGADSLRIRRVLAGQYVNPDIVRQRMEVLTPADYDYISCTWYFGFGPYTDEAIQSIDANVATPASLNAIMLKEITSGAWANAGMKGHVALAKSVGKKVICYEGGTDVYYGSDPKITSSPASQLQSYDPSIKKVYKAALDTLRNMKEVEMVMQFTGAGGNFSNEINFPVTSYGVIGSTLMDTITPGNLSFPKKYRDGSGNISAANSTTLTGSGTNFSGDFAIGDPVIYKHQWGTSLAGYVVSIQSNNSLTLDRGFNTTNSNYLATDGRLTIDRKNLTSKFQALVSQNPIPSCAKPKQSVSDTIGSGNALRFDGQNDYVDASSLYKPLLSASVATIEFWANPIEMNRNQDIVAYSNNSSTNSVCALRFNNQNKIQWVLTDASGNAVFTTMESGVLQSGQWYHVAAVKKGNSYSLYINGTLVSSKTGTLASFSASKLTLGAIATGTATTANHFNGGLDELRIYNTGINDINTLRGWMCKKFSPKHPNASAQKLWIDFNAIVTSGGNYFAKDRNSNTDVSLVNFNYFDKSNFVTSGAPIGDESNFIYPASWAGAGLSLQSPKGIDRIGVSNLGNGSPDGVHLYTVNQSPKLNTTPTNYQSLAKKYYGVFTANGTDATYDVVYNYQGNPDASVTDAFNRLVKRNNNADASWGNGGAALDNVQKSLSIKCKESYRGEYILGVRNSAPAKVGGSGSAIYLKGTTNSQVVIENVFINKDYTIAAWIKPGNANSGYFFQLYDGQDGRAIGVEDMPSVRANSLSFNDPNGMRLRKNEWNHVALTKNGSNITLFINGISFANRVMPVATRYNAIKLGSAPPFYGGPFQGYMDELNVWDVGMSETEIRDLMCKKITEKHPKQCEHLKLYFNFDEGAGSILEDKFGRSDARLENVAWRKSGAPIGDESKHNYSFPYNVTLPHPDGDNMKVTIPTKGTLIGTHVYRTDAAISPISPLPTGVTTLDTSRYWGVYTLFANSGDWWNTSDANIKAVYNYGNNKNVNLSQEATLTMIARYNDTLTTYNTTGLTPPAGSGFATDANGDSITFTSVSSGKNTFAPRSEFVLAGKSVANNNFNFNNALPIAPSKIIGKTTVCQGENNIVYRLPKPLDPNTISYTWYSSKGLLLSPSTSDTVVATASAPSSATTPDTIYVVGVNKRGKSTPPTFLAVKIQAIAVGNASIAGPLEVCAGAANVPYTVSNVSPAPSAYEWNIGGTGNTATGSTATGNVTFGNTISQKVILSVKGIYGCGTSLLGTTSINVNKAPLTNLAVTGDSICSNGVQDFVSVGILNSEKGATYYAYNGSVALDTLSSLGGNVNLQIPKNKLASGVAATITVKAQNGLCPATPVNLSQTTSVMVSDILTNAQLSAMVPTATSACAILDGPAYQTANVSISLSNTIKGVFFTPYQSVVYNSEYNEIRFGNTTQATSSGTLGVPIDLSSLYLLNYGTNKIKIYAQAPGCAQQPVPNLATLTINRAAPVATPSKITGPGLNTNVPQPGWSICASGVANYYSMAIGGNESVFNRTITVPSFPTSAGNTITMNSHGLKDGDMVMILSFQGSLNGNLTGGKWTGTWYKITNSTSSDFQLKDEWGSNVNFGTGSATNVMLYAPFTVNITTSTDWIDVPAGHGLKLGAQLHSDYTSNESKIRKDIDYFVAEVDVNRIRLNQYHSGYQWNGDAQSQGVALGQGTLTVAAGSTNVMGVGAQFEGENLAAGGIVLRDLNGNLIGAVSSIANANQLTLAAGATGTFTNIAYTIWRPLSFDNVTVVLTTKSSAQRYAWTLTPAAAGTITDTTINPTTGLANATVTWSAAYAGEAKLSIIASNNCGSSKLSGEAYSPGYERTSVTLNINSSVPSKPDLFSIGVLPGCGGAAVSTKINTSAKNATGGYQWQLESISSPILSSKVIAGNYEIDGCWYSNNPADVTPKIIKNPENGTDCSPPRTDQDILNKAHISSYASINWDAAYTGQARIKVRSYGCNLATVSAWRDTIIQIDGAATVPTPAIPTGTSKRCSGDAAGSTYSTTTMGVDEYKWFITPANAGSIPASTTTNKAIVVWNATFNGTAQITVKVVKCGALSSSSPALSVASTATPPVITDVQYAEPQLCASTDGKVNIKLSAAGGAYDVDLNNDGIFEKSAVAATGNDIVLSGFSNTFVVTNAMVRPAGFACASDVFSTNHTFVAPCVLTVDFTSDQTSVCAGKSVVYTDATTGGIPQSYYWDFGAGATPTTATTAGPHTVTYTKSGTPTVRLVIDSLIATKNAVFKSLVTVNAKPVVTILASGGTTFCSGATVKLSTAASGTIYKWYNNGVLLSPNSNNLEVTTSGKYNVMVTSSNTCSDSALTSAVVTVNQSPVITRVDSTSITNCGVNDGSINVTATGSNIEYSIGNIIFQASNLFQNLSAGSYTAVVRNVGGTCPVTFPQVLPLKGMKQANILLLDKTNPQNCGVNDGSITINTDMPTSGLQFSIDSGITWQPSNQFSGLVGATYKVAIKNSDGKCVVKSTQNAVITAPSAATIVKVIPVDPSDCGLTNGSITINATGGIAPLQYSIDNGATFQEGNVFNNLSGKTYNIVVTNANGGCKVNHTSSIVIAGKTAPVISSVEPTPPSSCLLNNGTITISATGNSGTLQYSIDGGTEWKNSPTFTSLAPGDYFVSIQYDNNTCQVTQTSAVAIAALGSPTITIDKTELCADTISTANLQAMPTGGTWSLTSGPGTGKINGSTYLSGSTGAPATIKYMLPNGCANTKQVLNVAMPETVAITSDKDRLCKTTESGMVINLNPAESGVNYFLKYNLNTIDSIIGSGASNTFKPQKNAGRYITQAVRKGNTVTCKVNLDTLTLIPTPVFVLKDTLSIGCGTSTDLTLSALRAGSDANATYKYFVDRSALTPLSNPSSINLAGNYFVQMTSSTCKLLDSIYVKQLNDLELKITNPPAFGCGNVADVTTASITQGSSLGGNLTYFKDQNGTSELTVPQNITAGGTYYIKLSKGNCSRIAAVVVEFENTLNLTITNPDPVNCGMPVDIMLPAVTAGSNSGLLTYLADTVTGEILNNPNRVMLPGEYFIMLSSGQCKTIKSVYVLLNGTPNLKINPPPAVCSPSTIDLKAPAITQGSQDGLTLSYWTSRNADTPIPNPANITQSGTYFIKGSVNSSCGIMLGVSVTINKGPTLSNVITGGLVCFGNDVPVTVASTIDTISYQPFFGSVAAGPAQLGNNGVLTFTIPNNLLQTGSEPFMVRASTPNCPSVPLTDTAVVAQVEQLLALDKIMGKLEVCKNENWVYKATNSRGYNLEWSLPDFATITQEYEGTDSIKLNFPIDIITADSLGVRTIKGKCKSPSTKLEIKAKKDCNLIFIPNVLTSSPSDNNSVWSIEGINSYPRSNIKVYNRWGTEVFASRGQTYKSWNGTTSSGSPLPTATYYFVIDLNDDERRSYTGSVTIVRE